MERPRSQNLRISHPMHQTNIRHHTHQAEGHHIPGGNAMSFPGSIHAETPMMFPPLLQTVQHCSNTCDHMATHLLHSPDVHRRNTQIRLLQDCATICSTLACFLARGSLLAKAVAHTCACICEVCGRECAQFPDQDSQRCARICLHCARECQAFAASA